MTRKYPHRYRMLTGPLAGQVSEGEQIGLQDFPGQFDQCLEAHGIDARNALVQQKLQTNSEGVYLYAFNEVVRRAPGHSGGKVEIGKTVVYDGIYEDLVVPFDRNGEEINVGDMIYMAVKNEVRLGEVVKIAEKVTMASYGIMQRKLTVRDHEEQQTLTINDSRATIKAPPGTKPV